MGKANEFIQLLEMAFSRNEWIDRVRDRYLRGAFGEYAKLVVARKVGIKDYWSDEVRSLLENVRRYMDPNRVHLKSKSSSRKKMLEEAIREASIAQDQILDAKNEMIKKFPKQWVSIKTLQFDSEKLFFEMVGEFLPEYRDLISNYDNKH